MEGINLIKQTHLPLVLRSYREADQAVLMSGTSIEKMLCKTLNFQKVLALLGPKIDQEDREALEKVMLTAHNAELIEQLKLRVNEIKLSHTGKLYSVLQRIPEQVWKDVFPDIHTA